MEEVPDADVIFAIGPWAASELTSHRFTTDSMLKKRGYVYWDESRQCKIIPLIDPAFVRAGKMNLLQTMIYDLKIAPTKEIPKIPYENLTLYPSPSILNTWVDSAIKDGEFGVCDIETPYSAGKAEDAETDDDSYTILRVSLAYSSNEGVRAITFQFTTEYLPPLQRFLSSGLDIVYWNGDYDVPRLEFNQCSQKGRLIDAMWLFHFLFPDLPRSLGSAASFYTTLGEWKSLSSTEPELYSCLDSYGTALCYLGIRRHLKEKGMWETAWRHVVLLQQVLRKMRNRGLIIDLTALEKFKAKLKEDMAVLQEKINTLVPLNVRPVGVILAKNLRGRCHCLTPKLGKKGTPLKTLVASAVCVNCTGTGWNAPITSLLDFNPSSPDQVKTLILSLGHPVPKVKDGEGGMKETTGERFLVDLVRMFPTAPYRTIVDYRKLNKMLTTYGEWPLQEVTEAHIDPLLFKKAATKLLLNPATGRLSSVNPNCFSADTEVLTTEGWQLFPDALKGDADFAQFDTETSEISFATPINKIKQWHKGKLSHILTDKQIDLLLTEDHQCLLQNRQTGHIYKTVAKYYPSDAKQLTSGIFVGGNLDIPESRLILIAALQADGHVRRDGYGIDFTFKRERKIIRLKAALDAEDVGYKTYLSKGLTTYHIPKPPEWLMDKKFFKKWILSLNKKSFAFLAEEVWKWDGCINRRSMYSSNQKENADWVQILTLGVNRRAKLRLYKNKNWQVDATDYNYAMTTNHIKTLIDYDDFVYCVTMPKGTVIVRRNNRVAITGQCQNIPKEGALADAFKTCIVARPGHRILKRDFGGIEAVLTGYFSKDPEYMRLALLGVHTYRCAQYLGEAPDLGLSDEDLGKALKTLKKKYDVLKEGESSSLYQRFKKINHMGNYKAGAKEMFDKSPGVFNNLDEVKKLNAFFIKSSPLRSKWWKTVEFRCMKEHRIVTPFMYNRWFWDMPADLTKAVAMEPQSTAAAIIKEAMLTIDATDNGDYMVLQVHDELVFDLPIAPGSCLCCPENTKTWEERDVEIQLIMEAPIKCLGDLVIHTEPSGGPNYASH